MSATTDRDVTGPGARFLHSIRISSNNVRFMTRVLSSLDPSGDPRCDR
jgi:hypothetical protein